MIEVVSWPKLSDEWDDENTPYFELYGETAPLVDLNYAHVLPVGPADGSPENTAVVPIYEYWWTIGHSGARYLAKYWSQLRDPAATISLYFPLDKGWRIQECAATVKYLSPVQEQASWWSKAAEGWKRAAPLLNDMSTIANFVPVPAFKGAASTLAAIARLQINSVPQVEGFEWSVSKITHKREKSTGYHAGDKVDAAQKDAVRTGRQADRQCCREFHPITGSASRSHSGRQPESGVRPGSNSRARPKSTCKIRKPRSMCPFSTRIHLITGNMPRKYISAC